MISLKIMISFPGSALLSICFYIHDYLPQYVQIIKNDLDLKCRKCKSEKTEVHKHNKSSVVSTHILKLYIRYIIQFQLLYDYGVSNVNVVCLVSVQFDLSTTGVRQDTKTVNRFYSIFKIVIFIHISVL